MARLLVLCSFLLSLPVAAVAQDTSSLPFLNASLTLEQRVDDLVSRMTLPEKISQMQYDAQPIPRLGVPAYNWWNECLHGVARNGTATVFPQAIGMAATWDPELIQREGDVIAAEARAKHHEAVRNGKRSIYTGLTFWSPNINIFRDPRWGRGQETYGEDPFLTSRIGVAFVRGLQGDDPRYFKVIATPKHFAVHSGPEPLRHTFDARTTKRDLFETYLPAFEATITEGGAWSIMGAYNRYMGEPCCASDLLLGKTLRGRWAFAGYVVSDCGAIQDIYSGHKVAQSLAEASAMAVTAGCDLTCGNEYTSLIDALARGLITERDIDRSVRRLMMARFRLGMFDSPEKVPYASIPMTMNDTREHDALARQVARESIVLLKNNDRMLPLRKDLKTVAVIGPNADDVDVLLGNYNGTPSHPVTVLQGIKNTLGGGTKVIYERGSEYAEGMPPQLSPVPSKNLRTTMEGRPVEGLTGSYYANMNLAGEAKLVRIDSSVNFTWAESAPTDSVPSDRFSARWTGTLIADSSATYVLGVTVDDGFRLFVDDSLFLEDWENGSARSFGKEIVLKKGERHALRLEYFENGGFAEAVLGWAVKGQDPRESAVAAAREADQIILVLGLSPLLEGEEMNVRLKGFSGGDRTEIDLPGPQEQLLEDIVSLGKPTVLVLLNGSALAVNWAARHVPAIVEAWYPGQQGGNAVADVLFGDYNPAGRLPVTFYRSVHDLPPFTDYAMKGRTYRYFSGEPLFPFGHGLSYTRFEYKKISIDRKSGGRGDTLHALVTVRNSGGRDGDEVVQLYVKGPSSGAGDPIQSLKAFKRVHLRKGETQAVPLALPVSRLRVFDEERNDYVLRPGSYEILAGASAGDVKLVARINLGEGKGRNKN